MKKIWKTFTDLLEVMPRGARGFFVRYAFASGFLSLLDGIALALVALAVTVIAAGQAVTIPIFGTVPQSMSVWLLLAICFLFIVKSLSSLTLQWVASKRFAQYDHETSGRLFLKYAKSDWDKRIRLSSSDVSRIVDLSVYYSNAGFLLPLSTIPGYLISFVVVLFVLLAAQPATAIVAFLYLGLFALVMSAVVSKRSAKAGAEIRQYSFRVGAIVAEMVDALKELTLRQKLSEIGSVVQETRKPVVQARAINSFLSYVPRYAIELALVMGFIVVGGFAFWVSGPAAAAVSVAMFSAAGFRILPALNGMQVAFNAANAHIPFVNDVINELKENSPEEIDANTDSKILPDDSGDIKFEGVGYRYPESSINVLKDVTFEIPFGSSFALVGPSGAGKSTVIDILMGLSTPTQGLVRVNGFSMLQIKNQWQSRIGYVPQNVSLFDGTLAQNVALSWTDNYDSAAVVEALERAHLGELVTRGAGITSSIGERGTSVSGGQQQRIGIARALYAQPGVLVMDEATSSLDTSTEKLVVEAMKEMQGKVTFIAIAHRLATVRDFDQICYLEEGRVVGIGSFMELVEMIPAFKKQAQYAGII